MNITNSSTLREAVLADRKAKEEKSLALVKTMVKTTSHLLEHTNEITNLAETLVELEEMVQVAGELTPNLKLFVEQITTDIITSSTKTKDVGLFESALLRASCLSLFFRSNSLNSLNESVSDRAQEFMAVFAGTSAGHLLESHDAFAPVASELAKLSPNALSAFRTHAPKVDVVVTDSTARQVAKSLV